MDYVRIVQFAVQIGLVVSLIFFVIESQKLSKSFIECQERLLCKEGMLTGSICDRYDVEKWNIAIPDFNSTIAATTTSQPQIQE